MKDEHARIVVTFAVDSFEYDGQFPNKDVAKAFAAGVQEGASYFGDGASAWVLPDELGEIYEAIKDDYVDEEEWQRIKTRLPEWAVRPIGTPPEGGQRT